MAAKGADPFVLAEFARYLGQLGPTPAEARRRFAELHGVHENTVKALALGHRPVRPRLALEIARESRKRSPRDPVRKEILVWGGCAYD